MKILKGIFTIYALIIFVTVMLLIFPFVLIASFFGHIKGGNMVYRLCTLWADIWFFFSFIRVQRIYEAPKQKHEKCIYVANHISYLDTPMIVKAIRQPVRPLGKVEMTKVPVFGFIYKKAIVTVNREDSANRMESLRILKSLINKGISVFVFPEGTFNMTNQPLKDFYSGAFRIAIETQTPIKPLLFLDTHDRLDYKNVFSLNPGRSRVMYLPLVPTEGLTLKDYKVLEARVFKAMEEKLFQYKASWIKGR